MFLDYRDQIDLAPSAINGKGLFESTPIVNNEFLQQVRNGSIDYKRGDISEITPQGVKFTQRGQDSKSGEAGDEFVVLADVIVMATGKLGANRCSLAMLNTLIVLQATDNLLSPPSQRICSRLKASEFIHDLICTFKHSRSKTGRFY